MASHLISGIARDPDGSFAVGDEYRFLHVTNTGDTVKGAQKTITVGVDGSYSIDLEYGQILVSTFDYESKMWTRHAVVTVNADTTASNLPQLLSASVPPTNEQLLQFQVLLGDTEEAATEAEASAQAAAMSESNAAASAAAFAPVNNPANFVADLDLPFNEGIELRAGYGDRDANGNRAATFSRASTTGSVNKSGVVDTLAIDEPSITSDGIEVYEAVTNEALWSEDFSNAVWIQGGGGVSITANATESPDGTTSADLMAGTGYKQQGVGALDSETFHFSVCIKKANSNVVAVRCVSSSSPYVTYNFNSRELVSYSQGDATFSASFFDLDGGWVLINIKHTRTGDGNTSLRVHAGETIGTESDSVYVWGAQVTKTSFPAPYIKTEDVPVTRSPDICSIPMMGNMPAAGKPFTIACDVDLSSYGSVNRTACRNDQSATSGFFLRANAYGEASFGLSDGSVVKYVNATDHAGVARYTIQWAEGVMKLFRDGVLVGSTTNETPTYNVNADIVVGANGVNAEQLNSTIKNFRIYHEALTDEQIAALGSAQ